MRLINETRSGGTSHYTLEPEAASDLGQPTEGFRAFVRALSWKPVSTAVSLGQFQHRVTRAFVGGHSRR
jgi:hypothetical protein